MLEDALKEHIRSSTPLMKDLREVRSLKLPDCFIAAGYIRGLVWDKLHGFDYRNLHEDIDVVYFDPSNLDEERDTALELRLSRTTGSGKWSVKNQARVHIRNGDEPYRSTEDAISKWPETATSVGARLDDDDELQIVCPYGLNDLFGLIVRRSPLFHNKEIYQVRIGSKRWIEKWPLLTVIENE